MHQHTKPPGRGTGKTLLPMQASLELLQMHQLVPMHRPSIDALAALVGAATKAPADAAVSQVGAPAASVDAPCAIDAPLAGESEVVPPATRGSFLLDAMIERDRERPEIKKQEKAAENEIKKQEKAALNDKARKDVVKTPEKKICKLHIKAAGATLAKKVGNAGLPKAKKACVNHEASRCQYLARSAGPSKGFAYGAGKEYPTSAKAMIAANAWLKRQSV